MAFGGCPLHSLHLNLDCPRSVPARLGCAIVRSSNHGGGSLPLPALRPLSCCCRGSPQGWFARSCPRATVNRPSCQACPRPSRAVDRGPLGSTGQVAGGDLGCRLRGEECLEGYPGRAQQAPGQPKGDRTKVVGWGGDRTGSSSLVGSLWSSGAPRRLGWGWSWKLRLQSWAPVLLYSFT